MNGEEREESPVTRDGEDAPGTVTHRSNAGQLREDG